MSSQTDPTEPDQHASLAHVFDVPGISCDHCKAAIEASVGGVGDVQMVDVDATAKTVAVTGGRDADIVAAINAAGYDVA